MISSSLRRPSASPASTRAELRHVVAPDGPGLDAGGQLAPVTRLLPVVAEEASAAELRHRDLRLAGPVSAHQRDVLSRPQRAGRVEDVSAGGDGDDDVTGERLFERARDADAELLRDEPPAVVVDIPHHAARDRGRRTTVRSRRR